MGATVRPADASSLEECDETHTLVLEDVRGSTGLTSLEI
jgi:hypothetical protein